MTIAGGVVRLICTLAAGACIAAASPIINILYDPSANFSAADQAAIQSAVDFYTANMSGSFTLNIAFGSQAGGGGSSEWFTDTATYNDYYNALVANSSGSATDAAAIASLGGGTHLNNPVTGSTNIVMTSTLAAFLGIGSQSSSTFADCGGLTANACITISQAALNVSGSPLAGLGSIVQHEVDEVLGTASNLPNGGGAVPGDPMAADLYRYSAAGVRSYALNASTDVPCTGSPTAYFSVDGGATNLQTYNNCNNGGDYGDWIGTDGLLIQDAFGPDSQAASLTMTSPEVALLDAAGYNFNSPAGVPEPASAVLLLTGFAVIGTLRKRAPLRGRN